MFSVWSEPGDKKSRPLPKARVLIAGSPISALVDSGCPKNIITETDYKKMSKQPKIQQTSIKLYGFGAKRALKFVGSFDAEIETKKKITTARVYVVHDDDSHHTGNLLSYDTCMELGIIKVDPSVLTSRDQDVSTLATDKQKTHMSDTLVKDHPELYSSIGRLKCVKIKLHTDETIRPVAKHHDGCPFTGVPRWNQKLRNLKNWTS